MKNFFSIFFVTTAILLPTSFNNAHAVEPASQVEVKSNVSSSSSPTAAAASNAAGGNVEFDHPGMIDRMMYKLSLTKDQKQKIHAIRDAKRQKAGPIHAEQKQKLGALQTALKSESDDEVRKAFNDLQLTNQKLSEFHLEGVLETRLLLTPEQRETFSGMTMHVLGGHKRGRHGHK